MKFKKMIDKIRYFQRVGISRVTQIYTRNINSICRIQLSEIPVVNLPSIDTHGKLTRSAGIAA